MSTKGVLYFVARVRGGFFVYDRLGTKVIAFLCTRRAFACEKQARNFGQGTEGGVGYRGEIGKPGPIRREGNELKKAVE